MYTLQSDVLNEQANDRLIFLPVVFGSLTSLQFDGTVLSIALRSPFLANRGNH